MADRAAYIALDSEPETYTNTLVMDPPYRISLKMGSIDDLFQDAPDTKRAAGASH